MERNGSAPKTPPARVRKSRRENGRSRWTRDEDGELFMGFLLIRAAIDPQELQIPHSFSASLRRARGVAKDLVRARQRLAAKLLRFNCNCTRSPEARG